MYFESRSFALAEFIAGEDSREILGRQKLKGYRTSALLRVVLLPQDVISTPRHHPTKREPLV